MTATASPPVGDLLYNDIENDLRASVRKLLANRSDWQSVLTRTESDQLVDTELWQRLAGDLFVTGLPIPEDLDGAGASWRETAVVCEELGRAVAPVPFLSSAVTATALALAADAQDLTRRLAAGNTAVMVFPYGSAALAPEPDSELVDGAVHARVRYVADAGAADVLLVPLADGQIAAIAAVDAAVTLTPVVSLDMTRPLSDVVIDGAPAQFVIDDATGPAALAKATALSAAMLASEQLGIAEWCLETTVAYLKDRRQFGRALGSYQALKHRCADLWVEISHARAVARYAAACAAEDNADLRVAAALAQAHCSAVALHAAEEAVQMHGGIAFTWEFPVHLRLKRAKADALAYGTPDRHRAILGELVDLPASAEDRRQAAVAEENA